MLDEDNSRYLSQVLRIKISEKINVTDGNGHLAVAEVTVADKKKSVIEIETIEQFTAQSPFIHIAIAPTKNPQRFEWFIEKACEVGISSIIPLETERSEKSFKKWERAARISVSAMLQSRQAFKTELQPQIKFHEFVNSFESNKKYIAHCEEGEKCEIERSQAENTVVLIGPEGDFSEQEIYHAISAGYEPVSLGSNRLRTETAGLVAAVLLKFNIR